MTMNFGKDGGVGGWCSSVRERLFLFSEPILKGEKIRHARSPPAMESNMGTLEWSGYPTPSARDTYMRYSDIVR